MQLTVLAPRCAHQRVTQSDCRACVDHCPQHAWTMDEDGLSLDSDVCDQCGQCVAACPLEALSLPAPIALVFDRQEPHSVAIACSRVPAAADVEAAGATVCLHGLTPQWLLEQARKHRVQLIELASDDCVQCHRAPSSPDLAERWAEVAQRLGDGAPQVRWIGPQQWNASIGRQTAPDAARRRFFRSLLSRPASTLMNHSTAGTTAMLTSSRRALVQRLAAAPAGIPLWRTHIDADACTGCMACVHLCPENALTRQSGLATPVAAGATDALRVHPHRCVGCGLCEDVCVDNAIHVDQPDGASLAVDDTSLHFTAFACPQCRQRFQLPTGRRSGARAQSPLCPTCLRGRPAQAQRVVQPS